MGNLSDIAQVNVSTANVGIKRAGFNKVLIADYHTRFAERVREYSNTDEMIADGFTVNDAAYKAASIAFSQSPQPSKIKIGRRALAPDLQVDLFPTAANTTLYAVRITGPAGLTAVVEFTSDGTATVAEVVAGLVAAINTAALGVTATNIGTGTNVRCKAASAGLWFSVEVLDLSLLRAMQTHADAGIATDLAAIKLADPDWYGFSMTTAGELELIAAATWIEANRRLSILQSQDGDMITNATDDVASEIKADNQFRSKVIYGTDPAQFPGVAWLSRVLCFNPGGVTFEYQPLRGVSAEVLTTTQLGYLDGKNAGVVTDYGGNAVTKNSKTAAGEWLDIIRDRDWFETRMQERVVVTTLAASAAGKKVPYTDSGVARYESDVRAQLSEGEKAGFLTDDPEDRPVVNVPKVKDMSTDDRAARRFGPIEFSATVAGAVHLLTINGSVSV